MTIKILTLENAKMSLNNLNNHQGWELKLQLFQEKFMDKIYPIISNYVRTPKYITQKNIISLMIYDHFYDDFHYKAAILELMCFIRDENFWNYSYLVINTLLGKDKEYSTFYNYKLLDSPALDKIGITFPISLNGIPHLHIYNNLQENKTAFIKHIENSTPTFGNFKEDPKTTPKQMRKVQRIFGEKFLSKEIIEIFLYAECYHNERIYNVALKDIELALKNFGYNPQWRHFVCKYALYLIISTIYESYEASKKLLSFSRQNTISETTYFINEQYVLPKLTINWE